MLTELWHSLGAMWQWTLALLEIVALVGGLGHVILRQGDSRSAAFWAAIITFVPLLGAAFYAVFGINRLRRSGQKYRARVRKKFAPNEDHPSRWNRDPELKELRSLATTLGRISRYEFTVGNKVGILASGDEAMPAMIDAIRSARRSVTLGTYIFEARGIGAQFVDALAYAKSQGVEVRVMVDDAGTRYSRPAVTRILAERGVKVARFMPHRFVLRLLTMNLRNHRKILVVDGEIGFTGGMNIRQGNMLKERPDHPVQDMHFRVEGPVARQLQRAFAEDWEFCADERLNGSIWYPELEPAGEVAAVGVPDGPDEDLEVMPKVIFAAINAARREIRVMTPYFLPDPQIQWALTLAALRGVDVKIITPRNNNIPPVRWAARTLYPGLLERNVQIFESKGLFDHTKFMTVDGQWSLIGSTNWDPRSLRLNFEFNLGCFDQQLAKDLNGHFDARLKCSSAVTLSQLAKSGVGVRLRDGFARMFIPIL